MSATIRIQHLSKIGLKMLNLEGGGHFWNTLYNIYINLYYTDVEKNFEMWKIFSPAFHIVETSRGKKP